MSRIKVVLDTGTPPSLTTEALTGRSYEIVIERGVLDRVGEEMKALNLSPRSAIITNPTVSALYLERLLTSLRQAGFDPIVVEMPDGEQYKTLTTASRIFDRLIEERMERGSPVIALGGGVVGDVAGYVAACLLRGVPFVQVPTTLLAQVDSSVGGKTGVNHPLGKNLIGAFYQPRAVFTDPDLLKTLDKRELLAGLAEIVKYGVIRDEDFFVFLEQNTGELLGLGEAVIEAIERSCLCKADVVGADEREQGIRSILNYGHTFGHAIEAVTNYKTFKHGEAVSIGMVMAAEFSASIGLCGANEGQRVKALLEGFGLPVQCPGYSPDKLWQAMRLDKKVLAGEVRFVLLEKIGKVVMREAGEQEMLGFLDSFCGAVCPEGGREEVSP